MKYYDFIFSGIDEDIPTVLCIVSFEPSDVYGDCISVEKVKFEKSGIGTEDDFHNVFRDEIYGMGIDGYSSSLHDAIIKCIKFIFEDLKI